MIKGYHYTTDDLRDMEIMYRNGVKLDDIARAMGRTSRTAIHNALKRNGIIARVGSRSPRDQ